MTLYVSEFFETDFYINATKVMKSFHKISQNIKVGVVCAYHLAGHITKKKPLLIRVYRKQNKEKHSL